MKQAIEKRLGIEAVRQAKAEMSAHGFAFFNALLLHHARKCRGRARDEIRFHTIEYKKLAQLVGYPDGVHMWRKCGPYLDEVGRWCRGNGLPLLNALAVNGNGKMPGYGYDGANGSSLYLWTDEVMAAIACERYPDAVVQAAPFVRHVIRLK